MARQIAIRILFCFKMCKDVSADLQGNTYCCKYIVLCFVD